MATVVIRFHQASEPMTFENVSNTYTKGDLFCLRMGHETLKFPLMSIFSIRDKGGYSSQAPLPLPPEPPAPPPPPPTEELSDGELIDQYARDSDHPVPRFHNWLDRARRHVDDAMIDVAQSFLVDIVRALTQDDT